MALTAFPRFATALLLATAALLHGQLELVGAQDACTEYDVACSQDSVCRGCNEAAGTNLAAYETCVANYLHETSSCVNQSMHACCVNEASDTDCLANENFTNYYDCRLQNDVGEDCTSLVCDAVGTGSPTPSGTAEMLDADSTAGQASPLLFGRAGGVGAATSMLAVATVVSVTAAAAAFV